MTVNLDNGRDAIGAAIGRIPSGCSVMTAEHAGRTNGVLVSWVQQAAFEPPSISVCLKHGRPIQQLVDGSGRFLLHAIGDPPTAMFKHFGKGFSLEDDAFKGLKVGQTEFGPMIEGCLAYLACRVLKKVEVGDHDLYAAEVVAASADPKARPYTHLRASAFSY